MKRLIPFILALSLVLLPMNRSQAVEPMTIAAVASVVVHVVGFVVWYYKSEEPDGNGGTVSVTKKGETRLMVVTWKKEDNTEEQATLPVAKLTPEQEAVVGADAPASGDLPEGTSVINGKVRVTALNDGTPGVAMNSDGTFNKEADPDGHGGLDVYAVASEMGLDIGNALGVGGGSISSPTSETIQVVESYTGVTVHLKDGGTATANVMITKTYNKDGVQVGSDLDWSYTSGATEPQEGDVLGGGVGGEGGVKVVRGKAGLGGSSCGGEGKPACKAVGMGSAVGLTGKSVSGNGLGGSGGLKQGALTGISGEGPRGSWPPSPGSGAFDLSGIDGDIETAKAGLKAAIRILKDSMHAWASGGFSNVQGSGSLGCFAQFEFLGNQNGICLSDYANQLNAIGYYVLLAAGFISIRVVTGG